MIDFAKAYFLLFCSCFLAATGSVGQTADSSCKVEIYLLKHPVYHEPIGYFCPTKAELADTPLVCDREILEYEISQNTDTIYRFMTSISVSERLEKSIKYFPMQGFPFAVVVNGTPVYGAYFWSNWSSFSCDWITAYASGSEMDMGSSTGIYLHHNCFSLLHQDPRQSSALIDCLKRTNRLKYK